MTRALAKRLEQLEARRNPMRIVHVSVEETDHPTNPQIVQRRVRLTFGEAA